MLRRPVAIGPRAG